MRWPPSHVAVEENTSAPESAGSDSKEEVSAAGADFAEAEATEGRDAGTDWVPRCQRAPGRASRRTRATAARPSGTAVKRTSNDGLAASPNGRRAGAST